MNIKPRLFGLLLIAVPSAMVGSTSARADATSGALKENFDTLKAIDDTADKICGELAARGKSQITKGGGGVKAQLSKLFKQLADLGITGTGSVEIDSYEGVLRSDLPVALDSIRVCRIQVFDIRQKN
jgi:hypothetical protein